MKYVGKRKELMEFVFNEQFDVDVKAELKAELKRMIRKDAEVKNDLKIYKDLFGISLRTRSLTVEQLNDMINFCVNNQLVREREDEENYNKNKFKNFYSKNVYYIENQLMK